MITRDSVVSAYRLILGRNPEDETVVEQAVSAFEDETQLRAAFLSSAEFTADRANAIIEQRFSLDLDPELPIEVECDQAQLQLLLARIGRTWEKLGASEPYWSVLTNEVFRSDRFQAHEQQFWESGKHDAARFDAWLARNKVVQSVDWKCLEYGCGTGRVTCWLAQKFKSVVACDISSSHLAVARERVRTTSAVSVDFMPIRNLSVLDQLPPVDVVFSIIVLQHNSPPIIAYILDRLLKSLRPSGVAYFQIPTLWRGYSFKLTEYLKQSSDEQMETHILPQRYVFEIAQKNSCIPLEVQPDNSLGSLDKMSTTFLFRKSGQLT